MSIRDVSSSVDKLYSSALTGSISRRDLIKRAAVVGVGSTAIAGLLAACEEADDVDDTDDEDAVGAADDGSDDDVDDTDDEPVDDTDDDDDHDDAEPTEATAGGSIAMAVVDDPCTLDPHVNSCGRDGVFMHALFDRLVEAGPDGEIVASLAEDWEVADDDVTWTFNLREDVTFHDGEPFNAEAAVFNFDRIVDPETQSEYAVFQLGPYDSSEAIDEYTLELRMESPYGLLLISLATYGMAMMSPAAVEQYGEEIGFNPVGSGPFMLDEWVEQSHVRMVRFEDYDWASDVEDASGPAALDQIEFRVIPEAGTRTAALLSGEVDMATIEGSDVETFEMEDEFRVERTLTSGYPPAGLLINTQHGPTDDVLVRQALSYGVDREEVNLIVYEGLAADADTVMSEFSWAHNPDSALYSYDPDRAAELLDEAGWVMGDGDFREKDGEPLRIVHLALTGVADVAEAVQAQLRNLGIDVELLIQDNPAQQNSAQSGDHHLVWTQWSGVDPADLRKIFHSDDIGSGWNFSHYDNPDVDELFEQGEQEPDLDARTEIYHELQMTLMEDAVYIPLNNATTFYGVSDRVQGANQLDERGISFRVYNFSASDA
jgi:peptide/nickel transport system substrate-binding protein